jgi:hypothetical protein
MSSVRWSISEGGETCTASHGGARVVLSPEEGACLRILIAATRQAGPGGQLAEWHGYVRSVDLLPLTHRRAGANSSIHARALIRRLKAALASIGLASVIVEHEHFGFRLDVVPDVA